MRTNMYQFRKATSLNDELRDKSHDFEIVLQLA